MPSDLLQSFMVLVAAIGAWLLARVLARVIVRTQLAEAPRIPPAAALAGAPAARPPTPQEVVLAPSPTPMRLLGAGHERRTRRLHLTDARKGIVLATILGPCRAHSPDETVDRIPFNDLRLETVARCDTVNTNVSRRFRGDLTQS